MGIIQSITDMFRDKLLEEILAGYGFEPDKSNALKVWRGHAQNLEAELEQGYDKRFWFLTLGNLGENPDEEDSIYLERIDPAAPPEEIDPDEKLDRFPGLSGTSLAKQYLLAGLPETGDYSILELPAVHDILPKFSPAVQFADLYFNRNTVVLGFKRHQLDRACFDRDLSLAADLAKAMAR